MRRREFCGGAILTAVALCHSPGAVSAAHRIPNETAVQAEDLLRAVHHRASAVAIGDAHLESALLRPRLDAVVRELMYGLDTSPSHLDRLSVRDLRARLGARTKADFAAGRTLQIAGWLLGETEVKVCCLAALWTAGS